MLEFGISLPFIPFLNSMLTKQLEMIWLEQFTEFSRYFKPYQTSDQQPI